MGHEGDHPTIHPEIGSRISLAIGAREPVSVFRIRGQRAEDLTIDATAKDALIDLRADAQEYIDKATDKVRKEGATAAIEKISERLNRRPLSEVDRYLLTTAGPEPGQPSGVYHQLMLLAFKEGIDPKEDPTGFVNSILGNLSQARRAFYTRILKSVLERTGTTLEEGTVKRVLDEFEVAPPSLIPGELEEAVMGTVRRVRGEGNIRDVIEEFRKAEGLPEANFSPTVRDAMVEHLQGLGIKDLDKKKHDEFLAVAFDRAAGPADGRRDPISLTRAQAQVVPWDFTVDTFETADQQDVDKKNILAAGALDYVFNLGERLGVFKLADALVLRWATGQVHVEERDTQNKLYRYWKLRDDRMTPEERGMLYKRVLDKGDAEVLPRMVVNSGFPKLWHRLMTEVADYITAEEDAAKDHAVSRQPIYIATQELQYDLTDHMTGMAHMQVTEMYHQLRDAFDLLGAREILSQASAGRRRNVWTVIERLAQEEFQVGVDVGSIRSMAVEGNKVFQWIASYVHGAVQDDAFDEFKTAAENWIIAAAAEGTDFTSEEEDEEEEEEEEDEDLEEEVDKTERAAR